MIAISLFYWFSKNSNETPTNKRLRISNNILNSNLFVRYDATHSAIHQAFVDLLRTHVTDTWFCIFIIHSLFMTYS